MPLVFVHGVNNRMGRQYRENVAARDALFRRFALSAVAADPAAVTIVNPYWGGHGASFAWNLAALPGTQHEAFGGEDDMVALLLSKSLGDEVPDPDTVLLQVARSSPRGLEEAVDLLWGVSAERTGDDQERAREVAELGARTAEYARQNPHPAWLDTVANDAQFLRELRQAATPPPPPGQPEAFGLDEVWDHIREARGRLRSAVPRLTSEMLLGAVRASLSAEALRFLGDVFTYLKERGTPENPGPIPRLVIAALAEAEQARKPGDDKLIVVAHSMGGNIMYDLLSSFLPRSHPNLRVDAFVTVGSQVAAFEELKLFLASDRQVPGNPQLDRVVKPPNVEVWLNVYDVTDVFGLATEGVFKETRDFSYSTGKGAIVAHGSYFTLPSFHSRLHERLKEALA